MIWHLARLMHIACPDSTPTRKMERTGEAEQETVAKRGENV